MLKMLKIIPGGLRIYSKNRCWDLYCQNILPIYEPLRHIKYKTYSGGVSGSYPVWYNSYMAWCAYKPFKYIAFLYIKRWKLK